MGHEEWRQEARGKMQWAKSKEQKAGVKRERIEEGREKLLL